MHTGVIEASDPVTMAIEKYKYHPSIIKLNLQNLPKSSFEFQDITESSMLKVLTTDISRCIINGNFHNNLKNADITPAFKKDDRLLKTKYRPVSIIPTNSKIYEKLFYIQIYKYFNSIFSKHLCGFRKSCSTQRCLLFMLENLKKLSG